MLTAPPNHRFVACVPAYRLARGANHHPNGANRGVELSTETGGQDRAMRGGAADALARRYATALFELAEDAKSIRQVEDDANRMREAIAASPDLRNLLGNPLFGREETGRALAAVAGHLQLSSLTTNFLGVLAQNRRLAALLPILRAFAAMAAAYRGEVTAEVTSARPLDDDQRTALTRILRERVGREVLVETNVDPALLGGLVVRLGSQLIDSSIRTRLNTLAQAMKG